MVCGDKARIKDKVYSQLQFDVPGFELEAHEITFSEVKRRAKRVKEELGDVADAVKEVGKQTKDVVSAAKGKTRRGRKPGKKATKK